MKRVVYTQRMDIYSERNEVRDASDQKLVQWLLYAGYLPFPIPNAIGIDNEKLQSWLLSIKPEAFLLTGGGDASERNLRFLLERKLLVWAEGNKIPVLGICRGMQTMAVFSGANLERVSNHVALRHRLCGEIEQEVNSFHQYALTQCPADYRVLATCQDGVIEAIESNKLPWQGWMWHPEREDPFQQDDVLRLQKLFG